MGERKKNLGIIYAALFAALISVSCFIQIPLPGGIPIVLQDMFAMLSGMLLGPLYGMIAVIVFLFLGCIGLPVFSGKAGLQVLIAGPTCGFLWGYLISAFIAGLLIKFFLPKNKDQIIKTYISISLIAVITTIILFVCGVFGFMLITKSTISKTLALVLFPFIPGNIIKIVLMVFLTKKFRPIIINSGL